MEPLATGGAESQDDGSRDGTTPARTDEEVKTGVYGSRPVDPVPWTPFQVGNRHNHYLGSPESVDDLIREPAHQYAPGQAVRRDGTPQFGTGLDLRETRGNRVKEVTPKTGALSLAPAHGLRQFVGSRLGRPDVHRPRISRSILRLTSNQGSSWTVPPSIAETRCSISRDQASSVSGSAGPSRLPSSSVASSARALRSRRRASARTA